MPESIRILATGVRVEEASHPEGGETVFVRTTSFVEFDDGSGPQTWEATPQGPIPVGRDRSPTTELLSLLETHDMRGNLLGELGIGGMRVSRFDFEAAPRRIDVAPALRERLRLD